MSGKIGGVCAAAVLASTIAESQTWAQPLLVPSGIVIRDASSVTLWSLE
jgi:hypothetical protein